MSSTIDINEAARMLGCCQNTILNLVLGGMLPRAGSKKRPASFKRADIEALGKIFTANRHAARTRGMRGNGSTR